MGTGRTGGQSTLGDQHEQDTSSPRGVRSFPPGKGGHSTQEDTILLDMSNLWRAPAGISRGIQLTSETCYPSSVSTNLMRGQQYSGLDQAPTVREWLLLIRCEICNS